MNKITTIAAALSVAVLMTPAASVQAQDFNTQELTYLTFSGPVEMPNLMLPAGTYTFRLADTPGRNVVQVLSKDDNKMLGQFLFIPAQRRDATSETIITFKESAENTRPAIQYWYYPGKTIGKEFLYPREQARLIAARTHSKVAVADNNAPVGEIDEAGNLTPLPAAQPLETPRASADTQVPVSVRDSDAVADTPQVASSSAPAADTPVGTSGQGNQVASNELPRTSSPLALSGLFGLLSLIGGLGARAARQSQ